MSNKIYIFLVIIIIFSCKKKNEINKSVKQVDKTTINNITLIPTFSEIINNFKESQLPFEYNTSLLKSYHKTNVDESIIEDFLGKNNDYYNCESSVKFKRPLSFSSSQFYYIADETFFNVESCKVLKKIKVNENKKILLSTSILNYYEFLVLIIYSKNEILDYKVISKIIALDEYNQFAISISKDLIIRTVNYSYYEGSPFLIEMKFKINNKGKIKTLFERGVELH